MQPAVIGHRAGRIGELFVAVMTRGQMSDQVTTPGYDAVGADTSDLSEGILDLPDAAFHCQVWAIVRPATKCIRNVPAVVHHALLRWLKTLGGRCSGSLFE